MRAHHKLIRIKQGSLGKIKADQIDRINIDNDDKSENLKSTTQRLAISAQHIERSNLLITPGNYYYTSLNYTAGYKDSRSSVAAQKAVQCSYRVMAAVSELFFQLLGNNTVLYRLVEDRNRNVCGHISKEHPAFSQDKFKDPFYEGDDTRVRDWHLTPAFAKTLAICWLLEEDDWGDDNRRQHYKIDHDHSLISFLFKIGVVSENFYKECQHWYEITEANYDNFPFLDGTFFRGIWVGEVLYKYKERFNSDAGMSLAFKEAVRDAVVKFSLLTKMRLQFLFSMHIERDFTYNGRNNLLQAMVEHVYARVEAAQRLTEVLNKRDSVSLPASLLPNPAAFVADRVMAESKGANNILVDSPSRTKLARTMKKLKVGAKTTFDIVNKKRPLSPYDGKDKQETSKSAKNSPVKLRQASAAYARSAGNSPLFSSSQLPFKPQLLKLDAINLSGVARELASPVDGEQKSNVDRARSLASKMPHLLWSEGVNPGQSQDKKAAQPTDGQRLIFQ